MISGGRKRETAPAPAPARLMPPMGLLREVCETGSGNPLCFTMARPRLPLETDRANRRRSTPGLVGVCGN